MMKKVKYLVFASLLLGNTVGAQPAKTMDKFIDKLMSQMTIDEKIGQLNLVTGGEATTGTVVSTDVESKIKAGQIGGIFSMSSPAKIRKAQELAIRHSRLKIPIIFGMDVIHGYKTMFPIPLGLASSWDMPLIQETASIAAAEAAADGINWTFSPMVDVSRDARWGRVSEGSGEDSYLGSQIAAAMVKGYQGDDLAATNTLMACVKHFALYGAAEAGRDYNSTDMSLHRMYNEYLPPYKAAIDAGAGTVMTAFNDINGVPATANRWLLTDLLRNDWGFKGMVVTDYTAVNELIDHGLGDLQKVSALALHAGVDMDMVGEGFLSTLKKSLNEGKVKQADIDRACRLILQAKYKLGLFKDPFAYCNEQRAQQVILNPKHLQKAREAAGKSFVLLKNKEQLLPLQEKGTLAVIGPLANSRSNMPGTWSVSADLANTASLVEGIKAVVGNTVKVITHEGSNLMDDAGYQERATLFGRTIPRDERTAQEIIDQALQVAEQADVIVAALGEASEMSGESSSRTNLDLPDAQRRLLEALLKTGKPVVLVLFTGRPLTLTWEDKHVPAIINCWFGGTETGKAVADVLYGKVNPSGKLPMSFPQHVGQLPLYYSAKTTGRPLAKDAWFQKFRSNYIDVSNEALYPFGYGLSYSEFQYGAIQQDKKSINGNESITFTLDLTNSGAYDGEEVIQLYVRDVEASITRPIQELKAFQKIFLKKGETKTITFKVQEEDLKFYNNSLHYQAEPGEFKVFIGSNSRDTKELSFTLNAAN